MTETWTIPCVEHVPDAEELEQLFQDLSNNKLPTLQWKNPGRRAASPIVTVAEPNPASSQAAVVTETATANDSYDFFDDCLLDVRIRKPVTPKSSAKKKTANFDSVLDSMKKHGRLPISKDSHSNQSTGHT